LDRTSKTFAVAGPKEAQHRIAELDGLRGLAVVMVLSWHFIGEIIDKELGQWAWWIAKVTIVGRTGVDLFFTLSGLLITGIILDRTRPAAGFLSAFYKRRALRILPPYLILLLVYFGYVAIGKLDIESFHPLYYLTFTQSWWMAIHGQWGPPELSVTWSVSVEEHYYFFFPIILLSLPRRSIPWILLLIAVASAAFRAWVFFGLKSNAYFAYVFPPSRLDGLALGGIVACIARHRRNFEYAKAHKTAILIAAFGVVLAVLLAVGWGLHNNVAFHMYTWGHAALASVFAALLFAVLANMGQTTTAFLRTPILRLMGDVSYSLYLFHPIILIVVFKLFDGRPRLFGWSDLGLVAISFALTLFVSGVLLRPMEHWFISHGRRFNY